MDARTSYLKSTGKLNVSQTTLDHTNSIHAITTKFYGPIWFSLFVMIIGQYPVKMDWKDEEHITIARYFYYTLTGLQYTLPCVFCRASFKDFLLELDINKFTNSRVEMMLWLYLMKDKVNMKLVKQEKEHLLDLEESLRKGYISRKQYIHEKELCFSTVPSPSFEQILNYYGQYTASCSNKIQKCVGKNSSIKF